VSASAAYYGGYPKPHPKGYVPTEAPTKDNTKKVLWALSEIEQKIKGGDYLSQKDKQSIVDKARGGSSHGDGAGDDDHSAKLQTPTKPAATATPTGSPTPEVTKMVYNTTAGVGPNRVCGGLVGPYLTWHSPHEVMAENGAMPYRGLYTDIDTTNCKFPSAAGTAHLPVYVVSLTGDESKWELSSTHVISQRTETMVRVVLQHPSLDGDSSELREASNARNQSPNQSPPTTSPPLLPIASSHH
jgi:hypothetical protein